MGWAPPRDQAQCAPAEAPGERCPPLWGQAGGRGDPETSSRR